MAQAQAQAGKKEDGALTKFFRSIFNFIHSIWVFFRSILVLLGISMLIILVSVSIIVSHAGGESHKKSLPDNIVLTYTFTPDIAETEGAPSLMNPVLMPKATLRDIVDTLNDASKDTRVKGLVAQLDQLSLSVAQIQELRDAMANFRKAGKFAYIYAESYGDMSPGMGAYYFSSSFDQLWLQPVGIVALNGVALQTPFVRGLLDKVGVEPQFGHKGIYKSAPESLTATDMSAPNREAFTSLVGDLSAQMTEGIAAERKMAAADVTKLIDQSPFTDKDALAAKLVDHVGYYDEALDAGKKAAGLKDDDDTVDLGDYADDVDAKGKPKGVKGMFDKMREEIKKEVAKEEAKAKGEKKPEPKKKVLALIQGVGEISSGGKPGRDGFNTDDTVEAFDDAIDDDEVAAIVFRVDSPGGSPTASESVHRAIEKAQKKGKPVIVSMSGYAASGGYWVSVGADKIVAEPGTITGSIGVFGGKFVFAGLWEKLAVNWVSISQGQNADMWSFNRKFTDAEFAKFDATLDAIYEGFLQRVMSGRHMTHDQAEAIAEGRVWTGKQAKEKGLVDELGGLGRAVEVAKVAAKLDEKTDYDLVQYPPPKSTIQKFIELAQKGAMAPTLKISAQDLENMVQDLVNQSTMLPVIR